MKVNLYAVGISNPLSYQTLEAIDREIVENQVQILVTAPELKNEVDEWYQINEVDRDVAVEGLEEFAIDFMPSSTHGDYDVTYSDYQKIEKLKQALRPYFRNGTTVCLLASTVLIEILTGCSDVQHAEFLHIDYNFCADHESYIFLPVMWLSIAKGAIRGEGSGKEATIISCPFPDSDDYEPFKSCYARAVELSAETHVPILVSVNYDSFHIARRLIVQQRNAGMSTTHTLLRITATDDKMLEEGSVLYSLFGLIIHDYLRSNRNRQGGSPMHTSAGDMTHSAMSMASSVYSYNTATTRHSHSSLSSRRQATLVVKLVAAPVRQPRAFLSIQASLKAMLDQKFRLRFSIDPVIVHRRGISAIVSSSAGVEGHHLARLIAGRRISIDDFKAFAFAYPQLITALGKDTLSASTLSQKMSYLCPEAMRRDRSARGQRNLSHDTTAPPIVLQAIKAKYDAGARSKAVDYEHEFNRSNISYRLLNPSDTQSQYTSKTSTASSRHGPQQHHQQQQRSRTRSFLSRKSQKDQQGKKKKKKGKKKGSGSAGPDDDASSVQEPLFIPAKRVAREKCARVEHLIEDADLRHTEPSPYESSVLTDASTQTDAFNKLINVFQKNPEFASQALDLQGNQAIHVAVVADKPALVLVLLGCYGASVQDFNLHYQTPYYMTNLIELASASAKMAKLLKDWYTDVESKVASMGLYPVGGRAKRLAKASAVGGTLLLNKATISQDTGSAYTSTPGNKSPNSVKAIEEYLARAGAVKMQANGDPHPAGLGGRQRSPLHEARRGSSSIPDDDEDVEIGFPSGSRAHTEEAARFGSPFENAGEGNGSLLQPSSKTASLSRQNLAMMTSTPGQNHQESIDRFIRQSSSSIDNASHVAVTGTPSYAFPSGRAFKGPSTQQQARDADGDARRHVLDECSSSSSSGPHFVLPEDGDEEVESVHAPMAAARTRQRHQRSRSSDPMLQRVRGPSKLSLNTNASPATAPVEAARPPSTGLEYKLPQPIQQPPAPATEKQQASALPEQQGQLHLHEKEQQVQGNGGKDGVSEDREAVSEGQAKGMLEQGAISFPAPQLLPSNQDTLSTTIALLQTQLALLLQQQQPQQHTPGQGTTTAATPPPPPPAVPAVPNVPESPEKASEGEPAPSRSESVGTTSHAAFPLAVSDNGEAKKANESGEGSIEKGQLLSQELSKEEPDASAENDGANQTNILAATTETATNETATDSSQETMGALGVSKEEGSGALLTTEVPQGTINMKTNPSNGKEQAPEKSLSEHTATSVAGTNVQRQQEEQEKEQELEEEQEQEQEEEQELEEEQEQEQEQEEEQGQEQGQEEEEEQEQEQEEEQELEEEQEREQEQEEEQEEEQQEEEQQQQQQQQEQQQQEQQQQEQQQQQQEEEQEQQLPETVVVASPSESGSLTAPSTQDNAPSTVAEDAAHVEAAPEEKADTPTTNIATSGDGAKSIIDATPVQEDLLVASTSSTAKKGKKKGKKKSKKKSKKVAVDANDDWIDNDSS